MAKFLNSSIAAVLTLGLVLPIAAFAAEAPHEIAGFALQKDIGQYKDKLSMETALPVRDMEYLTEVDVEAPPGFKSGQIVYGNCVHPGRIVKISMKYLNPDKRFFEKLLAKFKEKYGDPAEWRGDPFHVYVAWKWSFVDKQNNRISMILQHYSGDEDVYKNGNSVKLSMFELIEEERKCYQKKQPVKEMPSKASDIPVEVDLELLIPKP
jgi:hypothetical protein